MGRPLIGQVLSRMGKLSTIDIDEILAEQAVTKRQFGEIALAWGLCEPEHLCDAWCHQLADSEQRDLFSQSAQGQARLCLPAALVRTMSVIPLRNIGNQLVVAASRPLDGEEVDRLARAAGKDVRVVRADAEQIQQAIEQYYPA